MLLFKESKSPSPFR